MNQDHCAAALLVFALIIAVRCENGQPESCDVNSGTPCTFGEYCKPLPNATLGICECLKGYSRDSDGDCSEVVVQLSSTTPKILFEIDGPEEVQLPQKSVSLNISMENDEDSEEATFLWQVLEGTGLATSLSYDDSTLVLSDLKPGRMLLRVTVTAPAGTESRTRTLILLPAQDERSNLSVIVRPESPVHSVEGAQVVLSAEGTSSSQILSYKWKQDKGPTVASVGSVDASTLVIDGAAPGTYQFSVTVTDAKNKSASATVDVEVSAERDDAPKAQISQCGSSELGAITVRLPVEQLFLCGNVSTDDKGIVSYKWFRVDKLSDKLSVDTSGSTTSVLTLTNLQPNIHYGPYVFQLDVEDVKKQHDSTTISVFVNAATNIPPSVDGGGNKTVVLPQTSVILAGSAKDDSSIRSYNWTQQSGPSRATFANADHATSTVSDLQEGVYQFFLVVVDDGGLNGTVTVFVTVERGKNEPPQAIAANVTVSLPKHIAILDASQSKDDAGIVAFEWNPFDDVSAALSPLDDTDHKSVLYVTGLLPGTFLYNLTVRDQQGASDSTVVQLTVVQGVENIESVEMVSTLNLHEWTYLLKRKLKDRIAASIASAIEEVNRVNVHFNGFVSNNDVQTISFYVESKPGQSSVMKRDGEPPASSIIAAVKVVELLQKDSFDEFGVTSIRTLFCKLDCSGHGHCSDATKQCICDRFWMTSLFAFIFYGRINCAWSSLYFFLILLLAMAMTFIVFRRRSLVFVQSTTRRRFRRRRRYNPLNSDSDDSNEKSFRSLRKAPRLQPLPLPPSTSEDLSNASSDDLLRSDDGDVRKRQQTALALE